MNDNETAEQVAHANNTKNRFKRLTSSLSRIVRAGPTGAVFTVITSSPKLRAIAAAGVTGAFAFIGMHVDADTALAMITAAGALAGWGPVKAAAEQQNEPE